MKTKSAGRVRISCFISLLILTSTSSYTQFVNEKPFPVFPLNVNSAALYGGPTSVLVFGRIGKSSSGLFEDWSGYSIPFIVQQDSIAPFLHTLVPDTNRFWGWGLGGTSDVPNYSLALDNDGNAMLCWSKMFIEQSDVPPTYLTIPLFRSALYANGNLTNLFTVDSALNPQVVYDKNNTAHIVWEKVTPLDSFPPMYPVGGVLRKRFTKYSSEIFYQTRDGGGALSTPVSLGKGFLPQIRIGRDNSAHVLWLGADSSSAINLQMVYRKKTGVSFSAATVLRNLSNPYFRFYPPTLLTASVWSIDSSNTLHAAWTARSELYESKFYMLHYSESSGSSIDSSSGYLDTDIQYIFKPSSEINAAWASRIAVNGPTEFFYSSSVPGKLFSQVKTFSSAPAGSPFSLLKDSAGKIHAVFFEGNDISVLKDLNGGNDTLFTVYRGGTANTPAYIDRSDKVWMIGKKDSLYSLLNFSLADVGKFQNFTFPLQKGNLWQYAMYYIETPIPDFRGYNQVIAEKDTVMPNGKTYIILRAQKFQEIAQRILRRDGLKVFQYSLKDSMEYLRYDFSKSKGDTIALYYLPWLSPVWVQNIYTASIFNMSRRQFLIQGSPFLSDFQVKIADSVGIVEATDGLTMQMALIGAIIDGVRYGTIVGVEQQLTLLPARYVLYQNFPNPFNPATIISYQVPVNGVVTVRVYDVLGREVVMLMNEKKSAGSYTVLWDAGKYPSGVYFYRLQAGSFVETKKMVLVK